LSYSSQHGSIFSIEVGLFLHDKKKIKKEFFGKVNDSNQNDGLENHIFNVDPH